MTSLQKFTKVSEKSFQFSKEIQFYFWLHFPFIHKFIQMTKFAMAIKLFSDFLDCDVITQSLHQLFQYRKLIIAAIHY